MNISAEHREFIRLVANGSEQDKAYLVTVGNNKVTLPTARSKGSALAKKYMKEIESERIRLMDIITLAKDSEVIKTALNGVLSQSEVDAKLCESITDAESPMEKLKAIDLYNKRFGSNAPVKTLSEITGDLNISKRAVINFTNGDKP